MEHLLIVEDSRIFASLLRKRLEQLGYAVTWCPSFRDATQALELTRDFDLALLDLNLPDAQNGEIVDYVLGRDIPSVVFTGGMDDDLRDRIWAKGVLDYVFKEGLDNIDYLVALIQDVELNRQTKVLVVEDSSMQRRHLADLLRIRLFQVFEARNGREALGYVEEHPDIQLVITDYHMPDMDGSQLTRALRAKRSKEHLAIVGVSGKGSQALSARFIKNGANDFLNKPFLTEELYCRVQQNLSAIRSMARIRYLSEHDPLTRLNNRRAFFEQGRALFANAERGNLDLAVGLIDLDNFKHINDIHGHDAGDLVLMETANALKRRLRQGDLLCRYGGEEFCVVLVNPSSDALPHLFESLRAEIGLTRIELPYTELSFTASIGVCPGPAEDYDNLEAMISLADKMLYKAKDAGKNKVLLANRDKRFGDRMLSARHEDSLLSSNACG